MRLNKEQILKANDLKIIEVEVPEWGGIVRLKEFTGGAREEYIFTLQAQSKNAKSGDIDIRGLTSKLLSLCIVDDDGKPTFTASDIEALNSKSATVLNRLFEEALKLNGLDAKAAEQALKN